MTWSILDGPFRQRQDRGVQCLDEESLLAFLAGRLGGASTVQAREHIAVCATCNAVATDLIHDAAAAVRSTPPRTRAYQLVAGAVVADRYRLVRAIGEGGMGVVWEARSLDDDAPVAIKLLKGFDPAAKKRFLREIAATSSVEDPGLVRVVDVLDDVEAGAPALVLELLEGEALSTRLRDHGALGSALTLRLALELARTLSAVHGAALVHRDVKPANIWLTRSPARPVVLLDLGLVKAASEGLHATRITRTGHVVGTPAYMAPEQLGGERDVDARADLWSLGVVLHECAAGCRPYPGATPAELLRAIHRGPAPTMNAVEPALARILTGLLAPSRAARTARAEHVVAALAAIPGER